MTDESKIHKFSCTTAFTLIKEVLLNETSFLLNTVKSNEKSPSFLAKNFRSGKRLFCVLFLLVIIP